MQDLGTPECNDWPQVLYKMAFCFILFTASSPPDKSRQSPGTHRCQLCQGLVLAENHSKTRASISPGVMAVEWGINLDLECWEFWVMAVFSQAPLWLTFIRRNKHQHATDAVETLQSINLPVVAHAIHLHQWQLLLVCLLENIGLSWDDVSDSPNGPIWINLQISAAGRRLELCTPHYGWGSCCVQLSGSNQNDFGVKIEVIFWAAGRLEAVTSLWHQSATVFICELKTERLLCFTD